MRKNIIAVILCTMCMILPSVATAGLADSIRSFLAVKEARDMDLHQALNFGTEESPKYVILNGIGTDVLDRQSTIPDDMLSSSRAGTSPSWVLQPFSGCSSQCGTGVRTADYHCLYSGGAPGTCVDDKPSPETQSCQDFSFCQSCVEVHNGGGQTGPYTLSDGRHVYCHQSVNGGGWELLAQFSSIDTTRYAGMNLVKNNADFSLIGGTTNAVLQRSIRHEYPGFVGNIVEGLNWWSNRSTATITMTLPADKSQVYVGYRDAYNDLHYVVCRVRSSRLGPVLETGPILKKGASADWTSIYGGGEGRILECISAQIAIAEIRYVFVR
jgi:hypothetical protein